MDRIHRFVFEHRRLLAAVLTGLAVLTALSALTRDDPGVPVLVARHDLRSGHVLAASDLRTATMPPGSRPSHALDRAAAVGRRVAGPMRAGEAITDRRVLQDGALSGYAADAVLTTIRVDRADGLTGLRVGDRVDVVAVDPDGESRAEVVARSVEVVTLPPAAGDTEVVAVGIVTTEKTALDLATVALEARFSVITSS
ncbi:SAF domain-containing protein [Aeromicrobium sp. NPDC092404]|uniref:SAF domain-containing protein n=1 Tax=Aeromicrobium sp. NPDC092404 TaxID=3154976 RepID=UPI00343E89CE